MFFHKMVY